jgi:hypothetical protein
VPSGDGSLYLVTPIFLQPVVLEGARELKAFTSAGY